MELSLGLRVPATGARADVVVRAHEGARLDEVADLLLARVLPAGATGRLSVGGAPLDPRAPLGVPPLVQGALLQVDAPSAPAPPPGLPELRVVAGRPRAPCTACCPASSRSGGTPPRTSAWTTRTSAAATAGCG